MASVYGFCIDHQDVCAEWTGNFELHISSLEQMLPYLTAACHGKYTVAIRKYLSDIINLCPSLEKKYK